MQTLRLALALGCLSTESKSAASIPRIEMAISTSTNVKPSSFAGCFLTSVRQLRPEQVTGSSPGWLHLVCSVALSFCDREALSPLVEYRKHTSLVTRTESDPVRKAPLAMK